MSQFTSNNTNMQNPEKAEECLKHVDEMMLGIAHRSPEMTLLEVNEEAEIQYKLGLCYENGLGTEKDEKKAVEWYTKAAELGYAAAQNKLGWCYDSGIGVDTDEKKAVYWYTKAAMRGEAEAQYKLGVCYLQGLGVEEDEGKAVEWFMKAAEQGNAVAQY